MNVFQSMKTYLKCVKRRAELQYPNDKPAIRQSINDAADSLIKEDKLTKYQEKLLSNYAASLHPKD